MDKQSENSSASSRAHSPETKPNTLLVSERLTSYELEQLRQAQNEADAYFLKLNPNLRILKH